MLNFAITINNIDNKQPTEPMHSNLTIIRDQWVLNPIAASP